MTGARAAFAAVVVLSAGLAPAAGTRAAADPSAPEFALALQRRYDLIRDFSTEFTHTYEGGVLRKQITERGRLLIKKPGRMRWEYAPPEEKVFVSDGARMYSYIPQDKQVIVASIPREDDAATPTLFLAGKGNLTRDFTPSLVDVPEGVHAGNRAIKLVPKSPQREYDWLVLVVDGGSLSLRGLVTVDAQGGKSSFSFQNLKENVGLADKEFVFKIPRGVDVVTASSRQ